MREGEAPVRELLCGRVDPAVTQDGAGAILVRAGPSPSVARVTVGAGRYGIDALFVRDRRRHAGAVEDALPQVLRERLAGHTLYDEREERIAGVAVAPRRAGWEIQLLRLVEQRQDVTILQLRAVAVAEQNFVVGNAGRVRKEMPNAHCVGIGGHVGE
jgi:hypothetical protein